MIVAVGEKEKASAVLGADRDFRPRLSIPVLLGPTAVCTKARFVHDGKKYEDA